MTKAELLKDRYKVLPPGYPYCPWESGTILYVDEDGELFGEGTGYPMSRKMVTKAMADSFPQLFQPLQWWQERDVKDMPGFVKVTETPDQKLMAGMVMELTWVNSGWGRSNTGQVFPYTNCFEPADQSDYEAYLQTTNQLKDK